MLWYVNIALYLWELFREWLNTIFVIPVQNVDMLWLLIPVWMAWFFAEFFQEKRGTSMGNAITNAVVILWGSIDCIRQTLKLMTEGAITNNFDIGLRFGLIFLIFAYGGLIVTLGWKGNPIIKYIGRVREVTYVFAMFVPIFYNAIPFSVGHIISAIIFFPLFYFAIELLDRYTPNPKAMVEDIKAIEGHSKNISGIAPEADLSFGNKPSYNLSSPVSNPKTSQFNPQKSSGWKK